jgi:hypothetical protein
MNMRWKYCVAGLVVMVMAPGTLYAASAGTDDANNYSVGTWTNASNGGTGFGPWTIAADVGAVADMEDSTNGSGDINSTNDLSFKLIGGASNFIAAERLFSSPLQHSDTFSFTMAYNWDGGSRGVSIRDAFGGTLLNIDFSGGNSLTYTWNGLPSVEISTDYFDTASLEVTVTQWYENRLEVTIVRTNDNLTVNSVSPWYDNPVGGFQFYNGGHAADSDNYALYFNDLEIGVGPAALAVYGTDGLTAGLTNTLTVYRNDSLAAPLLVNLSSDDTNVVTVPATVTIDAGFSSTEFEIVGMGLGEATLEASAGSATGTYDVVVTDIAYDDSSYYSTWDDGDNEGLGFQPWILSDNNGPGVGFTNNVGFLLESAVPQAGDVNDPFDTAFGIFATGDGTAGDEPLGEATRPFSAELQIGEIVSIDLGVNFRNGAKGVVFQNGGDWLFEFRVAGDQYTYQNHDQAEAGVDLPWAYAADSEITVILSRVDATEYNIGLIRNGSAPETNDLTSVTLDQAPDRMRLYVFDTDGGNPNNLYFNNLAIYSGYYGDFTPTLSVTGIDAMAAGVTNVLTVSRNGPLDGFVTVALASSATNIVQHFPLSVDILEDQSSATFDVVGVDYGTATITVSASAYNDGTLDVDVFDIAYDDSAYYGAWTNGANAGSGFDPWILTDNDNGVDQFAGQFIGDSTVGAGNVNASSGDAFAMFANGDPGPQAFATRGFTELAIGQSLSYEMGINFRNGAKGATIQHDGTWLFEIAVFDNGYRYRNWEQDADHTELPWDYAADTALEITVSRVDTSTYNIRIARRGSAPEEVLLQGQSFSLAPNEIRFFNVNTDSGAAENNLYFNRLAVFTDIVGEFFTDGIPVSWWDLYSIAVPERVAADDNDTDTSSNWEEYVTGTNPTNALSLFTNIVEGPASASGEEMTIFTGTPTFTNRVYDVFWTTNLVADPQVWQPYGFNTPGNADNSAVSLTVTNDAPGRAYRTGVKVP